MTLNEILKRLASNTGKVRLSVNILLVPNGPKLRSDYKLCFHQTCKVQVWNIIAELQIQKSCSLHHEGFDNQWLPHVLFGTAICIINSLSCHSEISSNFKVLYCGCSLFKGCLNKWKFCRLLGPWAAWCSHIQLSASQSEMSDCGQNWPAHETRQYQSGCMHCVVTVISQLSFAAGLFLAVCSSCWMHSNSHLGSEYGTGQNNRSSSTFLGQLLCSHTVTPSAVLQDLFHIMQFAFWTARSFKQEVRTEIATKLGRALAFETDRVERRPYRPVQTNVCWYDTELSASRHVIPGEFDITIYIVKL